MLPADNGNDDRFSLNQQINIQPQPRPTQNPPIHGQNLQNPPIQPESNINQFQDDNNVCGVPVVLTQSLIIGGTPVKNRGEWPW